MQFTKKSVISFLLLLLFVSGCSSPLTPEKYVGDSGILITGNGAYDVTGDACSLVSVTDCENGWTQLEFKINMNDSVDDFYVIPLKDGVSVDSFFLTMHGNTVIGAYFENVSKLDKAFGWETTEDGFDGDCLKSSDAATEIMYLVQDGLAVNRELTHDFCADTGAGEYKLCFNIRYDWQSDNYDNLLYIGINKKD